MFIAQMKEVSDSLLLQQLFHVFKYLFIGHLTSTHKYDLESTFKAKKLRICIYQTFFFFFKLIFVETHLFSKYKCKLGGSHI